MEFTVNIEKLIHFHVGTFAFTGAGKTNLTSMVIRKALKVVPDLKVVIFDVSSEYGIHILDVLNDYPSQVFFTDSFKGAKKPDRSTSRGTSSPTPSPPSRRSSRRRYPRSSPTTRSSLPRSPSRARTR